MTEQEKPYVTVVALSALAMVCIVLFMPTSRAAMPLLGIAAGIGLAAAVLLERERPHGKKDDKK